MSSAAAIPDGPRGNPIKPDSPLFRNNSSTQPFCPAAPPSARAALPEFVTLGQASALVNRTAAGLRHYRTKDMPRPFVKGSKGKPNEYLWSEMRPWLEKTFGRPIPVT